MGKVLIIKGADFKANAVVKIADDKIYLTSELENLHFLWSYVPNNGVYSTGNTKRGLALINSSSVQNPKFLTSSIGGVTYSTIEVPASINSIRMILSQTLLGAQLLLYNSDGSVAKTGAFNSLDDTMDISNINTTTWLAILVVNHADTSGDISNATTINDLNMSFEIL